MSQDPGKELLNAGWNFTAKLHSDTYPAISPANSDLGGSNVFITGASKGCGKATAISFAQAGASGIALAARSPLDSVVAEVLAAAERAGKPKPKVVAVHLDVTKREDVEAALEVISGAFGGRLDVLINNAGRLSKSVPFLETDPDDYFEDYKVNILGPYLITRFFLPLLFTSPTKLLVNVASVGAVQLSPYASAYSCSKLALLRFGEFLEVEHGPQTDDGVIIVGVHPGAVDTPLARGLVEEYHGLLKDEARLCGDWMVWCASQRREWLSGRYISVNWDVEEFEGMKDRIVKGDLLKNRMVVTPFS
ncbi:unnamed protein product [Periconia digitata]|uniref:Uncharacterized protein n=1 Tax=Periconia digitata TaxID=1303443 RepID=A0A9W4ULW8_9PLEO|nr:unnamed protein product [Periconia digitata]